VFLVIIQLYEERYLEDVLLALTANGLSDAVILDAMSVGEKLASEVPIFAGFRAGLVKNKMYRKIIMCTSPSRERVANFVRSLTESGVKLQEGEAGKIIVVRAEELT